MKLIHFRFIDSQDSLTEANARSKNWRFAFQTFSETPARTPSTLGFGIMHQPHGSGDGAKCGAKFTDTSCITVDKASAAPLQKECCSRNPLFVFAGTDLPVKTHSGRHRASTLK